MGIEIPAIDINITKITPSHSKLKVHGTHFTPDTSLLELMEILPLISVAAGAGLQCHILKKMFTFIY